MSAEKLDYKKKFKELYQPKTTPSLIDIPEMIFFAVDGKGDPNSCQEYKNAIEVLYGMSFTVKMSKLNGTQPEGYFEYTVPPLEGLWYQEDTVGIDYSRKNDFIWTSMIRQPEFVTEAVFELAKETLHRKKPQLDLSKLKMMRFKEGLCVQLMHIGSYDNEPESIARLSKFVSENGLCEDFTENRFHHEIYLSDPRKCAPEKLKTVIRHPVRII